MMSYYEKYNDYSEPTSGVTRSDTDVSKPFTDNDPRVDFI